MATVPDNLMARLHEANQQFHRARQRANELDQMDSRERQSLAAALRAAEKEVEDAEREINAFLDADNTSSLEPPPGAPAPDA